MATKLPMEIINNILSYRERHPVAEIIHGFAWDMIVECYEGWGGSYPDDPDDEEGELTFDEVRESTLYENAIDNNYLRHV